MAATCQCKHGHTWTARVLEDDYTINSLVVELDQCPECNEPVDEVVSIDPPDEDDL